MRRDRLIIRKAPGLKDISEELRSFLKENRNLQLKEMEWIANNIYLDAIDLVPLDTGRLQDSINVDVSKSPRYPGIIAYASARNPKDNFDYAFEQETNESYEHDDDRQAHFLEKPFRKYVKKYFKKLEGKK